MFENGFARAATKDADDLWSVRISALLLVLQGCFFGINGLVAVFLLFAPKLRHNWKLSLFEIAFFLTFLALAILNFRAARSLRGGKRWATYVAIGSGLIQLAFSGMFVYDWLHPERQGPDDGFGFLLLPFSIVTGLWWCVSLNLPNVRAAFRKGRSQQK